MTAHFTVSLSAPAGSGRRDVRRGDRRRHGDGADNDYVPLALTGQTIPRRPAKRAVNVTVNGDTAVEPNETFFVNVTNVTGANVVDGPAPARSRTTTSR